MQRLLIIFCLFFGSLFSEEKANVLVSVAPYRFFIQQIADDLVNVQLMVPAGASAHSYEPTPKEMLMASKASLWFRLGEPFENKAIAALKASNPLFQVVDLRKNIPLVHSICNHCVHQDGDDLHIWLSPKLAKIQAETIALALIDRYPSQKTALMDNLKKFQDKLDLLDQFIAKTLQSVKNRTLLVSHPAYAYFCRDYNFTQLSIEVEGKDPTAKQLNTLLKEAKNSGVKVILTQPQYSDKAALLIAKQIHANLISVDPYAEEYIQSLETIAQIIKDNA